MQFPRSRIPTVAHCSLCCCLLFLLSQIKAAWVGQEEVIFSNNGISLSNLHRTQIIVLKTANFIKETIERIYLENETHHLILLQKVFQSYLFLSDPSPSCTLQINLRNSPHKGVRVKCSWGLLLFFIIQHLPFCFKNSIMEMVFKKEGCWGNPGFLERDWRLVLYSNLPVSHPFCS